MPMTYKFDFSIFDSRIVFLYTFQRVYMTTTAFLQPMTAAWGARSILVKEQIYAALL